MSRALVAALLMTVMSLPSLPAFAKTATRGTKPKSLPPKVTTPKAETESGSEPKVGLFSAYGVVAPTAEPGEVVDVLPTGQVRFFIGDLPIQPSEELRLKRSWGQAAVFLRVISVDPPTALAEVTQVNLAPYTSYSPVRAGQKIVVQVKEEDVKSMSFHLGATLADKVEDFGGTNYAPGINFAGWITPELSWEARLNVESLGKNSRSVEKRRGLYLVGLGHDIDRERVPGLHVAGLIGIIDTMTITEGGSSTGVDPYTGASYSLDKTVAHNDRLGYMLLASKRFLLKELSRTSTPGWALTPFVSYADTFERTSYKGTTTAAVAFEVLFD